MMRRSEVHPGVKVLTPRMYSEIENGSAWKTLGSGRRECTMRSRMDRRGERLGQDAKNVLQDREWIGVENAWIRNAMPRKLTARNRGGRGVVWHMRER